MRSTAVAGGRAAPCRSSTSSRPTRAWARASALQRRGNEGQVRGEGGTNECALRSPGLGAAVLDAPTPPTRPSPSVGEPEIASILRAAPCRWGFTARSWESSPCHRRDAPRSPIAWRCLPPRREPGRPTSAEDSSFGFFPDHRLVDFHTAATVAAGGPARWASSMMRLNLSRRRAGARFLWRNNHR